MKGFWGIATLALTGIIIADLMANPDGVRQAGQSLDAILRTTFSAMLGAPGR